MPRKISKEEADKLGRRPFGKRHPVRLAIEEMKKGDILHITRSEFTWKKRTPLFFINQIMKSSEKKIIIDETRNRLGWVVERVE